MKKEYIILDVLYRGHCIFCLDIEYRLRLLVVRVFNNLTANWLLMVSTIVTYENIQTPNIDFYQLHKLLLSADCIPITLTQILPGTNEG